MLKTLTVLGSISSIVGLILYFYFQEPTNTGQSNKTTITNSQSVDLDQSNSSNNEAIIDSSRDIKVNQGSK